MQDISGSQIANAVDISQLTPINPTEFVQSNVYYYRYPGEDLIRSALFLGKYSSYGNPVFQTDTNPPSVEIEIPTNLTWEFYTKTD
jgi:hypothetical protein